MRKSDLINAILFLSVYVDKEKGYIELVKNLKLPELVKMITHDLFIKEFDYRSCNDGMYEAYRLVLAYSKEISIYGAFNFISE